MGLLENQIQAALTLEKGRAVLSYVINDICDRYSHDPQERSRLHIELTMLVDTSKMMGSLQELHEIHLKDV